MEKVSKDEKLLERLRSAAGYEQVLEMAKESGMELSMADIAPQACEMTEGELEALNGGVFVQKYLEPSDAIIKIMPFMQGNDAV